MVINSDFLLAWLPKNDGKALLFVNMPGIKKIADVCDFRYRFRYFT
jgi:hypothetical protein